MNLPKKIIDDVLITSINRDTAVQKFGSQEFFIFTRLDKTTLSLEQFQKAQIELLKKNEKHNLTDSSCIHAAHKALTQQVLEPSVSTQRGYMRAKIAILPPKDVDFLNSFQCAFIKSGMAKSVNN